MKYQTRIVYKECICKIVLCPYSFFEILETKISNELNCTNYTGFSMFTWNQNIQNMNTDKLVPKSWSSIKQLNRHSNAIY